MKARFRSWWQKTRKPIQVIGIIAVLVMAIALIFVEVRIYGTGFKGKTLWDWLQLLAALAIPVVVVFGAVWFTTRQTRISEETRKQQHDTDLQIAEIQQQEEFLRTYFDKISDLLLDQELSTNPNIQSIVRARTLAALHILNTERKAIVLRFLHDTGLLQHVKSFLYSLDLSYTDLNRIDLSGADLSGALITRANLSEANLYLANLSEATMFDTKLIGALLSGVNLNDANVTTEQLEKTRSLEGATMPDGSIHD